MRIAGIRTSAEWTTLQGNLATEPPETEAWRKAFEEFYLARLETRYFQPINRLVGETDTKSGEGFSVVAILCTLVEFLESCERGHNFRYCKRGETPGANEYSQREAGEYFTAFLVNREPFKSEFNGQSAESFYRHVRCGLLHEARTKGGWLVQWAEATELRMVEFGVPAPILYRNRFLEGFKKYLLDYRKRLEADSGLRSAFVRKFDCLAS